MLIKSGHIDQVHTDSRTRFYIEETYTETNRKMYLVRDHRRSEFVALFSAKYKAKAFCNRHNH